MFFDVSHQIIYTLVFYVHTKYVSNFVWGKNTDIELF